MSVDPKALAAKILARMRASGPQRGEPQRVEPLVQRGKSKRVDKDPLVDYEGLWDRIARDEGLRPEKMRVDRISKLNQRTLAHWQPDLAWYDLLVVNSSAGKDSMAMLDVVDELATEAGVRDRIVVVHCDLGRVEHPGVRELAEEHAVHKRLPFVPIEPSVHGRKRDLLERFEQALKTEKGSFPGFGTRYCTSEFKTGEVVSYIRGWVEETYGRGDLVTNIGRRVRILNLLGLRAEESDRRAGPGFRLKAETQTRWVLHEWLPIQFLLVQDVWDRIEQSGLRYHPAYDVGFERLSCRLCPLAGNEDVKLAALVYPEMAEEIVALERKYPHKKPFKEKISLETLRAEAEADPALRAKARLARQRLQEDS